MDNLKSGSRVALVAVLLTGAALVSAGCDTRSTDTVGQKMDKTADKMATATDRATTKAAAAVDDAAITAKVKTAVIAEPGLSALKIDVDTKDGVVTLTGTVDSAAMKDRAQQVAQGVSGVRSVVDNLVVKAQG
jgi:osmotically-inducible protein OsmY